MEIPLLLQLQSFEITTLWTFAALILAAMAAFATRSKTFIPRLRRVKSVIPLPSSYSFSSDDDDSCSDSDSDDDSEEASSSSEEYEEIQGQDGKFEEDREVDWPKLLGASSVVKFWEGLDSGRNEILTAAEEEEDGHVAVKVWDSRTRGKATATWRTEGRGRLVGVGRKEEKVYVGDDVGRLTVVDLRNVKSTFGEILRWSDGVMTAAHGDGLGSWRRNAAMCFTLFPETG